MIAAAQYWHDPLNHTNYAHGRHHHRGLIIILVVIIIMVAIVIVVITIIVVVSIIMIIVIVRLSLLSPGEQRGRGEGGAVQGEDVAGNQHVDPMFNAMTFGVFHDFGSISLLLEYLISCAVFDNFCSI